VSLDKTGNLHTSWINIWMNEWSKDMKSREYISCFLKTI
jgi:hypothetical protein